MKRGLSLMLALTLGLALIAAAPGASVMAQDGGDVIAEGFNGPQGILLGPDESIYVIDSGVGGDTPMEMVDPATGQVSEAMMGDSARVVQVLPDGTQNELATLPSVHVGQDFIGGARLAFLNDKLYATSGEWHEQQGDKTEELMAAVVEIADGEVSRVADIWRSERRMNADGAQRHSHPYGMVAGPDGKLWIADAAGNSLLKVGPTAGFIETIASFEPLPGVFPNPNRDGEMLTDAVPTGIAFDDEGNAYVSLLGGAPFVPGSSKVVKVASGKPSDYATGMTMLTDIARGPDDNLYAVQFGMFTDQGPTPDSGAIIQIQEGEGSTPVLEGLSFPTSIAFNDAGDAYVTTNGVGAPGSGQVVMFAGLAGEGEMAEEAEGEMAEEAEGEMAEEAEGEMAEEAEGEMTEEAEGEMAEEAEGEMAEEAEGEMAEEAEGEMAEEAEGEMAEEAEGEMAEEAEGEMAEEAEGEMAEEAEGEMAEEAEGEMAEEAEGEMTEEAEGEMAEEAEGEMAEEAEGEMAEDAEGEMAEEAEGEMTEAAEGEMAEDAEGEMAAPEHLPATGASFPVSGALATALATIGLAAVGLFINRRRVG